MCEAFEILVITYFDMVVTADVTELAAVECAVMLVMF
jgi:hypothetical protein